MSLEAEMSVLGCFILEKSTQPEILDKLTPDMFLNETTRRIFDAATDRYWGGKDLDPVILIGELPEYKKEILSFVDFVPHTSHLKEYIHIVIEDWRKKTISDVLNKLFLDLDGMRAGDAVEVIRGLVREQDIITQANDSGMNFSEAVSGFLEWLSREQNEDTCKSGYSSLDRATGGFIRQTYTAVCARPGCGKTDFAVNLAVRMAKRGYRVQYFTMEMTARQLMERIASNLVKIDGTRIRDRSLSEEERRTIKRVLEAFERDGRINFVQEPKISLARVRRQIDLFKPDVAIIDHIGLMETPNVKDDFRALGMISNALKQLAIEKNIAVIPLVQLNRNIEGRKGGDPQLSDIRRSGDIEQDADCVLFTIPEDMTDKQLSGEAWVDMRVKVAKNRNGKPTVIEYRWKPQYHSLMEVETRYG